jgi:SAM-dependent methyltransferase
MADPERVRLRGKFDEVAELYDRIRPGYPPALLTDLAALAGVTAGADVLEIGCGTGQLTVPVARTGARVLAVELGPRLAAIARRNLAGLPAEVLVANVETWSPGERSFDAVLAATAFHWLDPNTRDATTAALLRPGGALATIATRHVAGGSAAFFADVQACYRRWDPATPPGLRLPEADDVPPDRDLDRSAHYGPSEFRRYEWERDYTTAGYLDLLRTYSGTLGMRPRTARRLLACVGELIEDRYAGRITKRYLTELRVARRR